MNDNLYEKQKRLVFDFQKNDNKKAILLLLNDYEGLIVKLASKTFKRFNISPLTFEDYFQYLTFCFVKRTKQYDFSSKMNYSSYIEKFLILDVNNYAKKYLTFNHQLMNYSSLINNEESNKFSFEEKIKFNFKDLDQSSLRAKQQIIFSALIKNEGNVKKTAYELNIPLKTVYRYRKEIIIKLNKNNGLL